MQHKAIRQQSKVEATQQNASKQCLKQQQVYRKVQLKELDNQHARLAKALEKKKLLVKKERELNLQLSDKQELLRDRNLSRYKVAESNLETKKEATNFRD